MSYRPPGLPHFGGIVERIIGTVMQMIHELPGTTFSIPDQRDISRIWVLETEGPHYLEIPYRTLFHPAVTLWEQRQAREHLRLLGREQVDEATLFRMIRQMRDIVDTAKKTTRKVRRDTERRQHLKTPSPPAKRVPPVADMLDTQADGQPPAAPIAGSATPARSKR